MSSQPRRPALPPRRPSTPRARVTAPRRFDRETCTWHGRICPTCRVETPTTGVCDTCS